jgi:2-dehydro-3-deoxygluconokinase
MLEEARLKYDVVTLGETMIRLSPPDNQRIEQAEYLYLKIGGAESNVAVDLARLGLKTAWVSRLVDNPLGRRIVSEIRAHGVDTSNVLWTQEGRVGTYFIEFGKRPRPISVLYDRVDSAITQLSPEDIHWDILSSTRMVHLTGITVALSDSCAQVVDLMIDRAREANVDVSFDVNYRSKLWRPDLAADKLKPICAKTNILFLNSRDAEMLFGCESQPDQMVDCLSSMFPGQTIAVTMGGAGAVCIHRGRVYSEPLYPAVEVDRVGTGDAFASGFLFGYLEGKNWPLCLKYGNALAAISYSIPGDLAITTRDELDDLVARGGRDDIER